MVKIDSLTAVAYTPQGLASALSTDNGIEYVYLGADITIQSAGGILVHPAKVRLVLDGLYEPESPLPRTLSDQGGDDGMIRINTPSRIHFTLQNMTIYGRNYHGMPRVYDTASAQDVVVAYRSVTYRGPQMTWHVNGLTQYIDCDISIESTGGSILNEVAEVRWLELGGRTVIRHGSTGWPAFLFRKAGSYLKVLEGAQVEMSADYDFLLRENDYPTFVIEPGASLSLTTQRGISRDGGQAVSALTVGAGAAFIYTRMSNSGSEAALYINGALTVEPGARVLMQTGYSGSTRQLVHFNEVAGRGLYLNSPKSFVLYNQGGMALGFNAAATPFSITGQQINYWLTARVPPGAGTLEDAPLHQWRMADWSTFTLAGIATSSLTTVQSAPVELPEAPDTNLMQLHQAQVFSVGDLPLQVDPVIIERLSVTGSTDPQALVRVDYTVRTVACRVECNVEADASFEASLVEEEEVPFGATVTVAANVPFLITTLAVTARYVEDMNLVAPEFITFEPRPIAYGPVLLPRREEDPENPQDIVVTDSREVRTSWQLWASIGGPLITGEGDTLDEAVVFVPPQGGMLTMDIEPQQIYADEGLETETHIVWQPDQGLLARITGPIRSGRAYTTRIFWDLRVEEEPEEPVDPEEPETGGDTP